MTVQFKNKPSSHSMIAAILIGAVFAIAVSVLLAAITAALITNGRIGEGSIVFIPYIIIFLGITTGSILCNLRAEGKYAIINTAVAAIYLFLLVASNIIFFDGVFNKLWLVILTMIVTIALSSFVSVNSHKPKKRKRYSK